jgi:hypothetical protein
MNNLKRCIRHTAKAKKMQGKADLHAALAQIYLAITEEEGISEFRRAIDDCTLEFTPEDFDEPEP